MKVADFPKWILKLLKLHKVESEILCNDTKFKNIKTLDLALGVKHRQSGANIWIGGMHYGLRRILWRGHPSKQ